MEALRLSSLSFTYPEENKKALNDISFSVNDGEFVTVCGLSGCGKSTLLRQLKTSLCPHGKKSGEVIYFGQPIDEVDERKQAGEIGFVMQSPEKQTVTDKVWHELAFGPESLGMSNDDIRRKTAELSSFFGISGWYNKKISQLSGGQKQILNIACAMITSPKLLVLDEPTAQLDAVSADNLMSLLMKINKELGTTVIVSEHDLNRTFLCSSRILLMEKGRVLTYSDPSTVTSYIYENYQQMRSAIPDTAFFRFALGSQKKEISFSVSESRRLIADYIKEKPAKEPEFIKKEFDKKEIPVLEMKEGYFRYDRSDPDIISGLSIKAYRGEILSVIGGNGAGKTTLLCSLAGISKIYSGKLLYKGKEKGNISMAYLPQDPQTLFLCETVREELISASEGVNVEKDSKEKRLKDVIRICRLHELLDRHPYDLSGGEQQRTALAKVLLTSPELILADEPVKGMDSRAKKETGDILRELARRGICIICVSHDMDFCAEISDRCAMLFNGELIGEDDPHYFFSSNSFYTTVSRRITEGIVDHCVTRSDILSSLGIEYEDDNSGDDEFPDIEKLAVQDESVEKKKDNKTITINRTVRSKKQTLVTLCIILFAVPFTIFSGIYYFNDSKYLFISLLICLECILPFYLMFEKRHVRAREMVLIASMCAICVMSRVMFYMLPEVKPLTAIVIISGATLGAESGFLIGSVSMLCSNVVFGQGPWTPWQMLAMGLIGLLSGLILGGKHIPKKRVVFSAFGFLCSLIIYGGIMDPAAAIMSHIELTPQTAIAYYAAGLPLDMIHAVSTAVFLFVGTVPIVKKLERIKLKYGLIEQ